MQNFSTTAFFPNSNTQKISSKRTNNLMHLIHANMIITSKESLAEEFDVSVTTIERWIREGVPRESGDQQTTWRFHRGKVSKWHREFHGHDA